MTTTPLAAPLAPGSSPAPAHPVWLWPSLLLASSAGAIAGALIWPPHQRIFYFIPFTFLGNSLAPLPYDGAVIYLGAYYPVWIVAVVGVLATVLVEAWNMELLARILIRDGARGFRGHPLTRWMLRWYERAPVWSLVATGVLPIVPHYPMRVLATLARFPLWKYQLSVILGRGMRYLWLGTLGWALHIPAKWIAVGSVVLLLLALRGARRMNAREESPAAPDTPPAPAEAP